MKDFASTVAAAIKLQPDGLAILNRVDVLAREFEVSRSTVMSWASGAARPHPRLQKQVLEFVGFCERARGTSRCD